MFEKAVFTTVEVLWSSSKPVLRAMEELEISFHNCRGLVKLMQACLRAREDLEISFHHCAVPVKLMQACLCAGKT